MKVYLVGGAVRDDLLKIPIRERDFVVVGATPDQLIDQGYRPVGRDFPVFLHPKTLEEYALARTERKTAPGYRGFVCEASPTVTLEEDLLRRDLTINAMARDENGMLIDPWGGLKDLEGRVLRHVSPAFVEDPVRILRLARFKAKLHGHGFEIAAETLDLMRAMVDQGEVDALVPERVFKEFEMALKTRAPEVFIEVLKDCGALDRLFPEVFALFGVPQDPNHHPEVDTGIHTLLVLGQSVSLSEDPKIRFAALVHDLGKGTTDPSLWPLHPGHEAQGLPALEALAARLKIPGDYLKLARKVVAFHGVIHKALTLGPDALLNLLEQLDAFRDPETFAEVLIACKADARGRPGYETVPYPQADRLNCALTLARSVTGKSLEGNIALKGPSFGAALRALRLNLLEARLGLT